MLRKTVQVFEARALLCMRFLFAAILGRHLVHLLSTGVDLFNCFPGTQTSISSSLEPPSVHDSSASDSGYRTPERELDHGGVGDDVESPLRNRRRLNYEGVLSEHVELC